MVFCALLAALMAVLSQLVLPVGPVPFNLATFGAFLAGMLLPPAAAAGSMAVYWAMALVGLPVLAGMKGGPAALFGPTGGYVAGYIVIALCTSVGLRKKGFPGAVLGMAAGLAACYALGTAWFMLASGTGLWQSLMLCVIPFLPADAAKAAGAVLLAGQLRRRQALR